jgi:uncharacterized protein YbaR (Trm112 family)
MKLKIEKKLEKIHNKIQDWHNGDGIYPEDLLFEIDNIVQDLLTGPEGLLEIQVVCNECNKRYDLIQMKRKNDALICPKCEGDSDRLSLIINEIKTSKEGKIIESESGNTYRVFKWIEIGGGKIIALKKELIN